MPKHRSHNTIPSTGYMHEGTLARIGTGEIEPFKPERKAGVPKSNPVGYIKVHSLVWSQAMELACGNAFRIQVIHETEVLVHNSESWRKNA